MKPIRHVFLVADGEEFPIDDSEGGATWLAAVLYEDGKGDRFLVIESWFDELAGWVGEASRHASLGDLLKQLTGEQIQRFGLR